MSGTTEADDWIAPTEPSATSANKAADDWQAPLEPGQHDYSTMGTMSRLGDQMQSGWEGLKQGVSTLGLGGAINTLQGIDSPPALSDAEGNPIPAPVLTDVDKESMRQQARQAVGARVGEITGSQQRQSVLASNPASTRMNASINQGNYGDAAKAFASDPLGIVQQVSVQGLPSAAPMMAAGALGALGGPIGAAVATAAGAYATDIGPRALGYMQEALQHAGVDASDPAAVTAAITSNPSIVTDAMGKAGRASMAPAVVNGLLGALSRPFLPGRGTGYNLGVAGGNAGIHFAGQPVAETGAQMLGTRQIDEPSSIVNAALGSLPMAAFHTGKSTVEAMRADAFRPGSRGLGSINADAPGPNGGPGGFSGMAAALLGFPTTIEQAEQAYRTAARTAHPDLGGSNEAMANLNDALEQAKQHFGAAVPQEQTAAPEPPPVPPAPPPAAPEPKPAAPPARGVDEKRAELYEILTDPRPTSVIEAELQAKSAAPAAPTTQEGQQRAATVTDLVQTIADLTTAGEPAHQGNGTLQARVDEARQQLAATVGQDGGATPEQVAAAASRPAPPPTGDGTRTAPISPTQPSDIEAAVQNVGAPTPAQAEAGNYQKAHLKVGGLDIAVENPAGSTRSGAARDGTPWQVQMPADYGYIKRTKGADGDQVDAYLGPDVHQANKLPVFVVDQIDHESRTFDEHKVMLGFPSETTARAAYIAGFSDGNGGSRLGAIKQMSWPTFRKWLATGNTTKPVQWTHPMMPRPKRGWTANRPPSLVEFLAVHGGLQSHGDLLAMDAHKRFVPGFGPLMRRNGGMTLDRARELAQENGYLPKDGGHTTSAVGINELLNKISDDLGGRRQFSDDRTGDVIDQEHAAAAERDREQFLDAQGAVRDAIAEHSLSLSDQVQEWAAVGVMHGESVTQAIYDAVMTEASQFEAELAAHAAERGDPNWDVPYEEDWHGWEPEGLARDPAAPSERTARPDVATAADGPRDGKPVRAGPPPAGPAPDSQGGPGPAVVPRPSAPAGQGSVLLPGFSPVTDGERAQAGVDAPLKGGSAALGDGLWSPATGAQTDLVDAVKKAGPDYGNISAPNVPAIAKAFQAHFGGGKGFASVVQARTFASKLLGTAVQPGTRAAKSIDEALELGIVRTAQSIAVSNEAFGKPPTATFDKLVDLYDRQPTLGTRTSGSVERQAYSTPAPLAYVADKLAGMTVRRQLAVFEPTAGNSALLMLADVDHTTLNEIDPERAANLRSMGFKPTEQDAMTLQVPAKSQDVVIANPPFGAVRDDNGQTTKYDLSFVQKGYTTGEIDHAISLRSLEAMKDDGHAVLILGGINKLVSTPEGRASAYNGKAKREFFFTLYGKYNVLDHFTVPGELYAKQGAGWPVDVVVIAGRGKSSLPLPSVTAPRMVPTWDALRSVLENADRTDGLALQGTPAVGLGRDGQPAVERGAAVAGDDQERPVEARVRGTAGRPGGVDAAPVAGLAASGGGAGGGNGGGRSLLGVADVPEPARGGGGNDDRQPGIPGPVEPGDRPSGQGDVPGAADASGRGGDQVDQPAGLDRADVPSGKRPADDVASAFDDAFADVFGDKTVAPAPRQSEPTVAGAATGAAVSTVKGTAAALDALTALFGNKDRLGSGPSFDEETWAKAKPLFKEALTDFQAAGRSIVDMLKAVMQALRDAHQWTAEMVARARPYLERFAREWRPEERGVETAENTKEIIPKPNNDGHGRAEPSLEEISKDLTNPPASPQDQAPSRPREQETATQVAYDPASKGNPVGTLVPTNMRTAVAEALIAMERDVGPIDAYVGQKLGYTADELGRAFSAEQVDALGLGIRQIDQGKGFIIGDQTGVGKGRFVAGLIRYAMNKGLVPVFVTEKPNLYGDMVRDLTDIGMPEMKDRVLVTNAGLNLPLSDDPKGPRIKTPPGPEHDAALTETARLGKLPDKYGAIFTTYSQMQQIGGKNTNRMNVLRMVAPNAFLILDEAHNAGGSAQGEMAKKLQEKGKGVPRSVFFRQIVDQAQSVAYSSATWAKRPDVLDLYGAKTDMREAVESLDKLADAIARGGVPMQQIVTAQLAAVGQYTRRERSFAGVTYEMHQVETDQKAYDDIAGVLARIFKISENHARPAVKEVGKSVREAAKAITTDGSVGNAGASSTGFGSVMHNLINQMLLASKAKGTVDEALAALRANEKPVIAVANTMGSFIKEFAEDTGARPGDAMDLTFNSLLKRYLARTLRYTVKTPFSSEKGEVKNLSVSDLGAAGAALYRETEAAISALDLSNMPVSPIDYIRAELAKEGYNVDEITGREEAADYRADGKVYYRKRSTREKSAAGRMKAISGFNGGSIDALILNQSGATGLSLHASEKVADQRKRRMLIAQAEANIDTHMQMLGRVHRTGQVVVPSYKQLVANVPAEQRPAAVLASKMASLSASTTSNRKGSLGAENAPDFINKYGGQVIAAMLAEDPDLDTELGKPFSKSGASEGDEDGETAGEGTDLEGLARKVTGRIPLLPLEKQKAVYADIEERYRKLIEELDQRGENGLEAKTLDLDARTLSSSVIKEGKGNNPFTSAATVERVDVKRSFKPPPPAEVLADVARGFGAEEPAKGSEMTAQQASDAIADLADEHGPNLIEQSLAAVDADRSRGIASLSTKIKDADKQTSQALRINAAADRVKDVLRVVEPGSIITIKPAGDLIGQRAMVLSVKQSGKKNAAAPSSWDVVTVGDTGMRMTLGLANVFTEENRPQSADAPSMVIVAPQDGADRGQFLDAIAGEGAQPREERSIVTGNILAGYAAVDGKGQIINYTDHTGATRQGVLMPKSWNHDEFQAKQAQVFSPDNAVEWLRHGGQAKVPPEVHTPGNELRIARDDKGGFSLSTAGSKSEGGAFFLDRGIRAAVGDLVKSGDRMRVRVDAWQLPELLKAVGKVLAREGQPLVSDHPSAKAWAAAAKEGDVRYSQDKSATRGWDEIDDGGVKAPTDDEAAAIKAAVQQIVGDNVAIDVIPGGAVRASNGGSMIDVNGLALGKLIEAARDTGKLDWTLHHEAIHALRNLGVFSPGEWATLERAAAAGGWVDEFGLTKRSYPDDRLIEEAVAEKFAQFGTGNAPAPGGMVGRAWAKLQRFFEALRNGLAGRGFRSAAGVFEDVKAGTLGEREPGSRSAPRGPETVEESRARVLDYLTNTDQIEKALKAPVAALMASLSEQRNGADERPQSLATRLGMKIADTPRINAAAYAIATHLTDFTHTVQMMASPMAHGGASEEARAIAKDFANARRLVRWAGNRVMEKLGQDFTQDQLTRMWQAADKESVSRQTGSTALDGLNMLEPNERSEVERMQAMAARVYDSARQVGIHGNDEPLPSYVPRMVVDIATGDPTKAAHVVQDIRTLALATMKLQEAIIGRQLINQIRQAGQQSGMATVWDGSPASIGRPLNPIRGVTTTTAQMKFRKYLTLEETEGAAQRIQGDDGYTWFTIPESPAFYHTTYGGRDEQGQPKFQRKPIYVRGDFEGPLRAVLRKPDGKLYRGAMDLKGRMMGAIMYGVAHLGVVASRALPISPNLVAAAREGRIARADTPTMARLIRNGLVPMGKQGGFFDAAGIERAADPKPGRSWTSQIIAAPVGLVSTAGATAIKKGVDKLGDITHGWMWDRVADLQAGIAVRMERELLHEGMAPDNAAKVGSHFGNRAAGALSEESMSQGAAKVANMMLFSRSYRLGNLGAVKDAINGLPRDVRAQIKQSGGEAALLSVRSRARRIAVAALLLDVGLIGFAGNAMLQSAIEVASGRHTIEREARGYVDRFVKTLQRPAANPFAVLQGLTPMSEHEPGKQNRILIGFEKDGTGIYLRNPLGKYAEDISDYFVQPIQTMKNMMSPYAHAAMGLITHRDTIDREIYDPYADTPARVLRAVGDYVGYVLQGAGPTSSIQAASDLVTGSAKSPAFAAGQIIGGGLGMAFSHGAAGGPLRGEMGMARRQHEFDVQHDLPAIRKLLVTGKRTEAVTELRKLGVPQGLMRYYIQQAEHPRSSPDQIRKVLEYATPEQRERILRQIRPNQ